MTSSAASRQRASRNAPRMQVRTTRPKPVVSYAESSTDEESNEGEDDSFTSEEEEKEEEPQGPPSRFRRQRNQPYLVSAGTHSTLSARASKSQQGQQKRPRPPSRHAKENRSDSHNGRPKRRKPSRIVSSKSIPSQSTTHIEGSGVIPAWQTLPYHVLVSIFQYATYPLYEEHTFQPLPSGRWLLNVARLCHGFAEPAFTVLYSSPPLVPMVHAHRLVDLLTADPVPLTFKYRQKVVSLRIDVGQVAAYSLPGSGHLDLYGLIKDLPRLTDLEFYHQKDMSPYRDLDDNLKWTYPSAIFDALEHVDPAADPTRGDKTSIVRLRSWRWSSRMGGKKYSIEHIPQVHMKPTFSSLQKVAFVNYQIPSLKKDEEDPKHEAFLAQALGNLPSLKHLVFESSTLMNAKLLPMLPTGLRNLELINCWEIVAEDFAPFLLTHGRELRVLTLNHNQSLSLSFLPTLGPACPNLQVFRMNLTYYNLHATYRDSEPQYENLLEPDQTPSWPSTLQTIELTQLRKWEIVAAEAFFQSLLNSAGKLPDLRHLTIQAILNIGWRDRASFRDKWVGALERVFKYVLKPPKPTPSLKKPNSFVVAIPVKVNGEVVAAPETKRFSLRSRVSGLDALEPEAALSHALSSHDRPPQSHVKKESKETKEEEPIARRSGRNAARNVPSGKYAESSDSEPEAREDYQSRPIVPRPSRYNRLERELNLLKHTAGKNYPLIVSCPGINPDGSDNEMASTAQAKDKRGEIIQGLCETVNVRIDNLRPTETQATEADFLDEEMSGDDDWNGDDSVVDGYAW